MLKDQKDLLAVFNAHGVRYLVVGAHAVGVHAEPRGTRDLDVFIQPSPANSKAVFAALAQFGAPLAGMSSADFNDEPGSVFQIGVPPNRVYILQKIEAVDFDEAWANRIDTYIADGIPTQIISHDDSSKTKSPLGAPRICSMYRKSAKPPPRETAPNADLRSKCGCRLFLNC